LVRIIEEKQKELLLKGNLEAAINTNIIEGATHAIIHHPEFTDQILESLYKFDSNKAMILNEFRNMLHTSRNVLKIITSELQKEKLFLSPRTEKLISIPIEQPLLPPEVPLLQQKQKKNYYQNLHKENFYH
jgi:hypothetical protein